jgi:hypothetical protein
VVERRDLVYIGRYSNPIATDSVLGARNVDARRKKSPRKARAVVELLPDEDRDIRTEVAKVIAQPDLWLNQPNALLGGSCPKDLVGTKREVRVRDLIRMIKYGIPS